MLQRRDVLRIGAAGLAAAALSAGAGEAQTAASDVAPPFDAARVAEAAKALAAKPFRPPSADLPEAFSNLSLEQYSGIQARPESILWLGDNQGFAVEPLHRGYLYTAPMALNVVEDGVVRRLAYTAQDFDLSLIHI